MHQNLATILHHLCYGKISFAVSVPVVPIEKDEQQEEEDHGAADGKQNLHLEST